MRLLLPIDSRVSDTQGFLVVAGDGANPMHVQTEEKHEYARRGFRGACSVGRRLYVCNSFSLKIYDVGPVSPDSSSPPTFDLVRQVLLPEWLIGRGANADLHYPFHDEIAQQILLANSYMDCIERFSLDGEHLGRTFLWEMSPEIDRLVRARNPKAADLCHVNHIERVGNERLLTLGNLNGSGLGAVMSMESGDLVLRELGRPHDGVWDSGDYFVTETSRHRLLVFRDIATAQDLKKATPTVVDLTAAGDKDEPNTFWLRGLRITAERIYVGCSQFQDRVSGEAGTVPTHIMVIDRATLQILDRLPVPSMGGLVNPVVYSLLDLDTAFGDDRSAGSTREISESQAATGSPTALGKGNVDQAGRGEASHERAGKADDIEIPGTPS